VTLYEQTVQAIRAAAAQAATGEDVLFCERRPLTSLEAGYAGAEALAARLREIERGAIAALRRLVDAEQGYESALDAIAAAGSEASIWISAVLLGRALEAQGER